MENKQTSRTWYNTLTGIDRRIIYVLLTIVMAIPLLFPFVMPLRISPEVQWVYDRIESLKPDDVVVLSFDFSPSSAPENYPHAEDILRHLATREGVRVIALSFWAEGPMLADQAIAAYQAAGKEYGIDCVNLGYCVGGEAAVARFAEDIVAAFPKDFKGVPTDSHPIMDGVRSAHDIELVVDFAAGSPGPRELIRQVQSQYKKDLVVGAGSAQVPMLMAHYHAGQISGMLSGLRGAAEYEVLLQQPGSGTAGMGSQTMGHLLIILFLILGNIGFFASKKSRGREVIASE